MSTRTSMSVTRRAALASALGAVLFATVSCSSFQPAPGTPDLGEVVNAVESVLKERYYQAKVFRTTGHAWALSPIEFYGTYPSYQRIDVWIEPVATGHYMPRVVVRTYVETAEPPLEGGNHITHFDPQGNAYAPANWKATHFDRALEIELRNAIMDKLNVPA